MVYASLPIFVVGRVYRYSVVFSFQRHCLCAVQCSDAFISVLIQPPTHRRWQYAHRLVAAITAGRKEGHLLRASFHNVANEPSKNLKDSVRRVDKGDQVPSSSSKYPVDYTWRNIDYTWRKSRLYLAE
jgi:hypothetical protein